MKNILLLLITLTTFTNVSYASFPVIENIHDNVCENIEPPSIINKQISWGVLSLSCAIISIVLMLFMTEFALTSAGLVFLLELLAIIFGVMGFKDKPNGKAITGFILGVVSVLLSLIAVRDIAAAFGG